VNGHPLPSSPLQRLPPCVLALGVMLAAPVAARALDAEPCKPGWTSPVPFYQSVAWSPDGSRIAFAAVTTSWDDGYRIFVVDRDDSVLVKHVYGLMGTRGGGAKRGTRRFLDPADRLSLWEARQWSECYAPWSREMGDAWVRCRRGRLNRLGLVWAIVLDNMGPRQLEDLHGMRHGTARQILAEALWRYAEISGIWKGR